MFANKEYHYLLSTNRPVAPRKIAEYFGYDPHALISVTDLQDGAHGYGHTWYTKVPLGEQLKQHLGNVSRLRHCLK